MLAIMSYSLMSSNASKREKTVVCTSGPLLITSCDQPDVMRGSIILMVPTVLHQFELVKGTFAQLTVLFASRLPLETSKILVKQALTAIHTDAAFIAYCFGVVGRLYTFHMLRFLGRSVRLIEVIE